MKVFLRALLWLFIVASAILFFVVDPATQEVLPQCIFHSATGYYCPGCGSQRAIHELLHLNFAGVVQNNLLLLLGGLLVVYQYSYSFLNKKLKLKLPNLFQFKSTPWIILGVVLLFWILRNLPVHPFTMLAPV